MERDILAEEDNGDVVGIEIQMYAEAAPFKRARYYLSDIDMSVLEKGKDYGELPAVTMVYITKKDIVGGRKGYYLVERKTDNQENITDISNESPNTININNGVEERYYNLRYPTGDKKVDELLFYFKNSDPHYQTDTFPRIVERVRYFKIQEKGVSIMCEIADRIRNEGKIESRIEDILELLKKLGNVPQQMVEIIRAEENLSVLSRWFKMAARAESIAEFEANM